jgi:arylsulfate sulfotransferase
MRRLAPIVLVVLLACEDTTAPSDADRLAAVEPTLVLNPSGIAPLSASFRVETPISTTLTTRLLGQGGDPPIERTSDRPATQHELAILGLYPGAENLVEFSLTTASGVSLTDTVRVSTEALPDFLPDVEITVFTSGQTEPGWTLSSVSIGVGGRFESHPIMFDERGQVRWYLDLSGFSDLVFAVEPLRNGNLLIAQDRAVFEMDRLGTEVNRWEHPNHVFHHDVIEKPDGNLIVSVDVVGRETVEDHIIEIDRATGDIVREWDMRTVLDIDRFDYLQNATDWFHMNAVWFDPSDQGLIISGRNQGVVKVSRENELVWILAPHRGWGSAGVNGDGENTADYLLTAVDANGTPYEADVQDGMLRAADFDWSWGQHAPMILPNGNVFIFDNGNRRRFSAAPPYFSRGVEYEIDEEAMTVREVWEYGTDRGRGYYSAIISDVDYLPWSENRLIMPGIVGGEVPKSYITEVTESGSVVFEAVLSFKNLRGSGAQAWGELDISYRSERIPLHPDGLGS